MLSATLAHSRHLGNRRGGDLDSQAVLEDGRGSPFVAVRVQPMSSSVVATPDRDFSGTSVVCRIVRQSGRPRLRPQNFRSVAQSPRSPPAAHGLPQRGCLADPPTSAACRVGAAPSVLEIGATERIGVI